MSGWRPIKTAPKDGTHIHLWREDIQFVGYYAEDREPWPWIVNAPGLPPMNQPPTHWMPLPNPPESQS